MSVHIRENLVIDALEQAIGRENPQPGFIFHDDQGTQYTAQSFQKALVTHGIIQSVSRPGNPYDNAVAESFFKTLKTELTKGKKYADQEEARQEIFKYIELYYNTKRLHSSLGYMSPSDYECESYRKYLTFCPI
jgi:putative transposase